MDALFSVCCLSVAKISHAALCTMHAEVIKASMHLMQQPMSLYLHCHHVGEKRSAAVLTKTLTATAKAVCSCSCTREMEDRSVFLTFFSQLLKFLMIGLQALWALAAVQKSLVMGRKQAASAIMNTLKKHCTKPYNRKLYDQFPSLCDQLIRLCNHQPPAKAKYAFHVTLRLVAIVLLWPLYDYGHCAITTMCSSAMAAPFMLAYSC